MRTIRRAASAVLVLALLGSAGCSGEPPTRQERGDPVMRLTSEAFDDGAAIPIEYAMRSAGGQNVSIPFEWSGVPQGAESLALELVDTHPVARSWVHWLVIDIPVEVRGLERGASPDAIPPAARELRNSFGQIGYGGPQPPAGTGPHRYVATLWALDTPTLQLPADASLAEFEEAAEAHALATASWSGTFER